MAANTKIVITNFIIEKKLIRRIKSEIHLLHIFKMFQKFVEHPY